ncbi:methyltransferase domain-containing protein [Alicyclobacillus cycloheptanicus]|uniref:Ubiquinone/menaquinone biosynthesis C-methylase UbiE n=1 Tax=Alicyclobacillus cycloheptanicus TaxID=1457 RepID=A0ABT9XM88_9BACL|nr:methyltransferase domain-containing protein [Alicyclobacillus cycloheptanicus]MDQ0191413.1 ubiquinone/menaquinone biosynthesis C-methylase UbiE [Alicyclobacillus cycloheptanicus]WDM00323.1 methyltransferase domain-containing protein [Alicyclobacillus cycloheptanicus]
MNQTPGNQQTAYQRIDAEYQSYLADHPDFKERWLLAQTAYTGQERRALLSVLPLQPGQRVLDVGTGFGAMAFDLAAQQAVAIDAVDLDDTTLSRAAELYRRMSERACFHPDSSIHFRQSNVYQLPAPDAHYDFVVARYVFQHLNRPVQAMKEILRVLKPGGQVCVVDIDDQLTLTYPDHPTGFSRLQEAFCKLQEHRGGDRFVGRKLASYLHEAGFVVLGTVVQPQSQFTAATPNDLGLQLTLTRFREIQPEIVALGLMSNEGFEENIRFFIDHVCQWQFHTTGQIVALGQRPDD